MCAIVSWDFGNIISTGIQKYKHLLAQRSSGYHTWILQCGKCGQSQMADSNLGQLRQKQTLLAF